MIIGGILLLVPLQTQGDTMTSLQEISFTTAIRPVNTNRRVRPLTLLGGEKHALFLLEILMVFNRETYETHELSQKLVGWCSG